MILANRDWQRTALSAQVPVRNASDRLRHHSGSGRLRDCPHPELRRPTFGHGDHYTPGPATVTLPVAAAVRPAAISRNQRVYNPRRGAVAS
eukprot:3189244-Rhodomonas_salina.1